jgi:hypothetical protein
VVIDSPIPGFAYVYRKPPDTLRITKLINPAASITRVNARDAELEVYREIISEGKALILSNIEGALIEYIRRVTEPTLWDPLFSDALALKLAGSLCSSISGSGTRIPELNALYEQALARAKVVNANNDSSVIRSPTTIRDSRR